jgi:DNA-binding transcriptional LysR family regulator
MSTRGFGAALKDIVASNFAANGFPLKTEDHAADDETLLSLVAAGRGLMFRTSGAIRKDNSGLTHVEVRDMAGTSWITFYACWKKELSNPALPGFLTVLRSHLSTVSSAPVPDT